MIQYKLKISEDLGPMLKHCEEIWVAVAMVSDSGFKYIQKHINSNAKQNYVIGIWLPTSPHILKQLKDKEGKGIFRSKIYKEPIERFHPKVYIVKTGQILSAFVGSANCTLNGFESNYEVSVMTDDTNLCKELLDWFKALYKSAETITDDFLDSYKPVYKRRVERIKQSKKEIRQLLTPPSYYIINTNKKDGPEDELQMLKEHKAAAYYRPKKGIEKLQKGDKVFLYHSGKGIIATGIATGVTVRKNFRNSNKPEDKNQEYYQILDDFKLASKIVPASEINRIKGSRYIFGNTLLDIGQKTGKELWKIR